MPVILSDVFDYLLLHFNCRDRITDVMLSRVTIIVYIFIGFIFLLDYLLNYYERVVTEANTILSELVGKRPFTTIFLSVISLIVIYVIVNLIFIYVKATFLKMSAGKPPFGRLVIAYKFIWPDSYETEKVFTKTKELFPNKKLIQLYYNGCRVVSEIGVAYGVILDENGAFPDDDTRHFLFKNNFRLFSTPAIENAVHIACPIISWLIGPTYYIALRKLYPRFLQFCEKRSLCAYPVIEIFEKDEITLFAPLARQEAFVVEEAEDLFRDGTEDESFGSVRSSCRSYSSSVNVSNSPIELSIRRSARLISKRCN